MKRYRRLRRLEPDPELIRRRAGGETVRQLAPDYGVSHTTLSRYFARPDIAHQLKQAKRLERAEQQAAEVRLRVEQKAERAAGAGTTSEPQKNGPLLFASPPPQAAPRPRRSSRTSSNASLLPACRSR